MTVGTVSSGRVVAADNIYSADSISPVQKLLNAEKAAATSSSTSTTGTTGASASDPTDYQDQSWYITLQVGQLKAELATYSAVPGLDPSGAIQDQLTNQVNTLVGKVQAQEKAAQASQAAVQAKLTAAQQQATLDAAYPSVDQLLQRASDRASGKSVGAYAPASTTSSSDADSNVISSDQMLANAKGSNVNTTARVSDALSIKNAA